MKTKILAMFAAVAGVLGFASPTFAAVTIPADPTGGAMGDVQSGVQTWTLTYGLPALFGLILLGILIRLGIRWTKRAGRSV